MSLKSKGELPLKNVISQKWTLLLCVGSFYAGILFTNRIWTVPESKAITRTAAVEADTIKLVSEDFDPKSLHRNNGKSETIHIMDEVSKTNHAIRSLGKTISNLQREVSAARASQGSFLAKNMNKTGSSSGRKYFMVIGINTAFSSRKRRDSVRATWMPQGEKRRKLEEERGIVIRFVIGHSAVEGGELDRSIEAEEKEYGDFMRLDHVEGYLKLSAKTKTYFSTASSLWDAEYYVKVDDDVHVNIGALGETLAKHREKPHIYIGCMKADRVLHEKGVRYREPEHWKFGDIGSNYFRHASGQLYAISKDLADYISTNQDMLHKYANEDVSLGSWFIGLNVEHIDDKTLCCKTPPECETKAQAGNFCAASVDWNCSGICNSPQRIKEVHLRCGEAENAAWTAAF